MAYELLERQKKLTVNQWKIIATANLGDMLDFFDFFLIGYVLAFIVGPWHLTFGQSAMVLVSSGLGAVPGALFWGCLAELSRAAGTPHCSRDRKANP